MAEKTWIKLGQPYLFTRKQYEYCKARNAPVAVIYYDTKTSVPSKELYNSVFADKTRIKELYQKLSSYGAADPSADKYKGGYCCLFVLDRCGRIQNTTDDLRYFIREFLDDEAGKCPFVALALSFDGNKTVHALPAAASADALASLLYDKCESGLGGVSRFGSWTGRQTWIDAQPKKPDPETKPAKSGQSSLDTRITQIDVPPYWENPPEKKVYANYDPDYSGDFSGIPNLTNRPNTQYMLNLADISTPETTYFLAGSYDMKNKTRGPKTVSSKIMPYIEKHCDNIETIWDTACLNGGFRKLFENGKKYRYFIFYEFSHGGNKLITIGISYDQIWNTFKDMRSHQRVWGMFDSCHSGSMIQHDGVTPKPFSAAPSSSDGGESDNEEIMEYIDRLLARRAALFPAVTGGQITQAAAAATYDPRMVLWSSTRSQSYGWYSYTSTEFVDAFEKTMNSIFWTRDTTQWKYPNTRYGWATDNKSSGEQMFYKLQEKGSKTGSGGLEIDKCIPWCRNYPSNDSFETNMVFY